MVFRPPGRHGHGIPAIILVFFSTYLQNADLLLLQCFCTSAFARIPPFKKRPDANTGRPACQAVFSTFLSTSDGFVVDFYGSKACARGVN
ncbi:MAG: hypothetical protein C0394_06535 [Syntrophus sp. (in: bacteria)]|nr:hypothetical protein [Syntrophus sp. (in: bacteria)]